MPNIFLALSEQDTKTHSFTQPTQRHDDDNTQNAVILFILRWISAKASFSCLLLPLRTGNNCAVLFEAIITVAFAS
jgi:hypothetical protein